MKIKRALISLWDKEGAEKLAKSLQQMGVEIVSTGNTAKFLEENGVEVTPVEKVTGSPEILDGRVKTLHPKIHGGILAKESTAHQAELDKLDIKRIDLVAVNLYPFTEVIKSKDTDLDTALENIDIGGPTMVRAAAKNYKKCVVLVDTQDYNLVLDELKNEDDVSTELRKKLAVKAFSHTAKYDGAITEYLSQGEYLSILAKKKDALRYGENPHQQADVFSNPNDKSVSLINANKLNGKELSYNNYNDADAALNAVVEFGTEKPAVVAVKHATPCGIGQAENLKDAFIKARKCDEKSIFGGIVAVNTKVDEDTAKEMNQIFLEIVIAPSFTKEALEVLKKKKNLRLLEVDMSKEEASWEFKSINGGLLRQSKNQSKFLTEDIKVACGDLPKDKMEEILFAYKSVKHVKSNAIAVIKGTATVGLGCGATKRIDAAYKALEQAKENGGGEILASDAFFPFEDVVNAAANYNIKYILQPGGSKNDHLSIEACKKHGITMILTKMRHFKH
ncbi:bifunctional phosphoribosylaminoimidazolecarboxamide formyltransferase/IMP cyclohydrolase [Proteinivorax hydrogeniformans]|uniref:Bifunctional purine biosynthesis protein PurH n=1 Tax=Proteinivorax hydrogeniformans TaxID=1826727 RepID=A0AAU8HSC1_9FIRM